MPATSQQPAGTGTLPASPLVVVLLDGARPDAPRLPVEAPAGCYGCGAC